MLIEDLTITAEVSSLFGTNVYVKGVNISYGINALSSANIQVEVSKDASMMYHNVATYAISEVVGTDIIVRWQGKNLELFRGKITGIQIDKSESLVAYSVNCSGGPLAFYNTAMSIRGWYPQGSISNGLSDLAYIKTLFSPNSVWSSPRTFMEALINQLDAIVDMPPNTISDGTKNAAKIVKSDLTSDLVNLIEPSLLQNFWGSIGDFPTFREGIKNRMKGLVQQEGATFTYWQILLMLCEEIGLYVVPWINKTMILPSALFCTAPKANVLFPSVIRGINVVTDPFTFPDQLIIPTDAFVTSSVPESIKIITKKTSIAVPETLEDRNSPYIGNRYQIVVAPKYARHILLYSKKEVTDKIRKSLKEDPSTKNTDKTREAVTEGYLLFENFAKNYGEFLYKKMRTERNAASVVCAFQPYIIPGFSCYTLDAVQGGMSFRGVVSGINHTITETDAQTTVTLTNVVFPVTDQLTINSPLWKELLPSGENASGSPIASELMSKVPGYPATAAVQVQADTSLLTSQAMSSEEEAAKFTGRVT